MRLFGYTLSLLLCCSLASAQAALASLTGKVVDQNGLPVSAATVSYVKKADVKPDALGRPRPVGPFVSASVTTDAAGAFSVSGLPSGTYYLCAVGPLVNQLSSCEWRGSYTSARVADGQAPASLTMVVTTGTLVQIAVQDPNSKVVLPPNAVTGGGGLNFIVGVISDAGFYKRAQLASRTATSLLYVAPIPKDLPVRLIVGGSLSVTDANSQPVAVGTPSLAISPALQDQVALSIVVH